LNKFSKDLIKSLGEAADHTEGRASSARVHVVEVPDVRAIGRKLHLSQQEYAKKYRIPLPTLRHWEQGGAAAGSAGGSLPSRDSPGARTKSAKLSSCYEGRPRPRAR